jgi:membrane-associated PAP2 superfamily phosphatase
LKPSLPPDAGRRAWLPEALVLTVVAVVATLVFAYSSLDVAAARVFFRPDSADRWPLARELPWSALYRAAPWITASLVLGGLAVLAAGFLRDQHAWRRHAIFLVLSVVLGPGLLINAVFKDHWDRPRPREILEFGGPLQYVRAPLPGQESGASFPCGHCSVGFLYGAGWWIWRKRKPLAAQASLATGMVVGLSLGIGRMAAGGHFLSDVIWSAILAYGICHVLYFHVLRLDRYDWPGAGTAVAGRGHDRWHHVTAMLVTLGGVGVLTALFAAPHGTQINTTIALSSLPSAPRVVMFEARSMDVDIVLLDPPASGISVVGELHGFGLPTSRLRASYSFRADRGPALIYRIEQQGWFTDLNGAVTIMLPADRLERVVVRLRRGSIRVRDRTSSSVVATGAVQLDLQTGDGHVRAPPRGPQASRYSHLRTSAVYLE